MGDRRQGRLFVGVILILLGLGLFATQFVAGLSDAIVLFLLGGAFMAGYLSRRAYGLLIPGCILLGLGLGSVGEGSLLGFGDMSSLGLGLGFIAIYVIALLVEGRSSWWPLIPGGILLVNGLASGSEAIRQMLSLGWPLLLVLLGLLILASSFGLISRKSGSE